MAKTILADRGLVYATQGNIGHPGTAAQRTADQDRGILNANAKLGPGVTISAVTVVPAR